MNERILIKRTEKERDKISLKASGVLTIAVLMIFGVIYIMEFFDNKVSCNGSYSCSIESFGIVFITFILIFIFFYIFFWIYYLLFKWKEATNEKTKLNSKRRKLK